MKKITYIIISLLMVSCYQDGVIIPEASQESLDMYSTVDELAQETITLDSKGGKKILRVVSQEKWTLLAKVISGDEGWFDSSVEEGSKYVQVPVEFTENPYNATRQAELIFTSQESFATTTITFVQEASSTTFTHAFVDNTIDVPVAESVVPMNFTTNIKNYTLQITDNINVKPYVSSSWATLEGAVDGILSLSGNSSDKSIKVDINETGKVRDTYLVISFPDAEEGEPTEEIIDIHQVGVLPAPVAKLTDDASSFKIEWDALSGVAGYQLKVTKSSDNSELFTTDLIKSDATDYNLAGVELSEPYTGKVKYTLRSFAGSGESTKYSTPSQVEAYHYFGADSGDGTSDEGAFDIKYARHLSNISKLLGAENSALYFKQSADINLQGVAFNPISSGMDNETNTYQGEFCGSYNGAGFKISNWSLKNNLYTNLALFSQIGATGLVKGVNLVDVDLLGGTYLGGISARNSGTIENCSVSGVITSEPQTGNNGYCGGMAAIMYGGVVKGCSNSATITSMQKMVAGIVGEVQMKNATDTFRIEDCHNSGNITSATEVAGGIVGRSLNTYKAGDVTEASDVALEIIGCSNSAEIVTKIPYTGGIIGNSNLPTRISQCYNTGDIKTKDSVLTTMNILGGIVGSATNGPVKLIIEDCYNAGSVTAVTTKVNLSIAGGIIGRSLAFSLTITSCHNVGVTSSPLSLNGGILGFTLKADKVAMGGNYSTDAEGVMQRPTYDAAMLIVEGYSSQYKNVAEGAMADQATFVGWDFSNVWKMDSSKGYPTLK